MVHSAGTSASRNAAATSTETCPASVIFITSSVASSVTRRRPTMRRLEPELAAELGRLRPAAVDDGDPDACAEERAHRGPDAGRRAVRDPRQLAADLHHEPAAGESRERAHGQSPGSVEGERLVEAHHHVEGLDRLPGAALDQVVERARSTPPAACSPVAARRA